MRILSIHSRYQIRGGEDECREAEEHLLREMGHVVEVYEDRNERVQQLHPMRVAVRSVWSREAYRNVKQRLSENSFDAVHVQNFLPLISPSVYYAAKAKKVPVVQTLHNYRLLCPNGLFFRQGQVCEDCIGMKVAWPGVQHGCYRESRAASATVATMLSMHHSLGTWNQLVDVYIALTQFARQKFIEGGLPADKIAIKPNFVHPDPGMGEGRGGYALFVGRLSVEKGLDTLLAAWEQLDGKIPLKIIGDGPLASEVVAATKKFDYIQWLGRLSVEEVYQVMGEAMMLIFPSKWYETFGRVAVEAFAKGTPVIAAKIGAIAELVEHGHTGLHFCPADPQDLAAQVEWAIAHPHELSRMRYQARQEFESKYTAMENYRRLAEIYQMAASG